MSAPFDVMAFWRDQLSKSLQDRDWAESMLDGRLSYNEIRVTTIALMSIDSTLFNSIHNLGGLAADW